MAFRFPPGGAILLLLVVGSVEIIVIVISTGHHARSMFQTCFLERFAISISIDHLGCALDLARIWIDDDRFYAVADKLLVDPLTHATVSANNPVAGWHRDRFTQFDFRVVYQASIQIVQARSGDRHADQLGKDFKRVDDGDMPE